MQNQSTYVIFQTVQTYFQRVGNLVDRCTHYFFVSLSSFALRCQPKVSVSFGLIPPPHLNCTCYSCLAVSSPLVCLLSGVRLRLLLLVNGWISKRQVCWSVLLSTVILSRLFPSDSFPPSWLCHSVAPSILFMELKIWIVASWLKGPVANY